jgi:hypothetical protein
MKLEMFISSAILVYYLYDPKNEGFDNLNSEKAGNRLDDSFRKEQVNKLFKKFNFKTDQGSPLTIDYTYILELTDTSYMKALSALVENPKLISFFRSGSMLELYCKGFDINNLKKLDDQSIDQLKEVYRGDSKLIIEKLQEIEHNLGIKMEYNSTEAVREDSFFRCQGNIVLKNTVNTVNTDSKKINVNYLDKPFRKEQFNDFLKQLNLTDENDSARTTSYATPFMKDIIRVLGGKYILELSDKNYMKALSALVENPKLISFFRSIEMLELYCKGFDINNLTKLDKKSVDKLQEVYLTPVKNVEDKLHEIESDLGITMEYNSAEAEHLFADYATCMCRDNNLSFKTWYLREWDHN